MNDYSGETMNLIQRATGYLSGSAVTERYDSVISTWENLPEAYRLAAAENRAHNFRRSFQALGQALPFALEVGSVVHSLFTHQPYSAVGGVVAGELLRAWSTLTSHNYLHWAEPLAQVKQNEFTSDYVRSLQPEVHNSPLIIPALTGAHGHVRDSFQISPPASVVPAISSSTAERV